MTAPVPDGCVDTALIGAIAAIGALGGPTALALDPLDAAEWSTVLENVVDERLTGVLVDGVARGDVTIAGAHHEELLVAHEAAMIATVRLESLLLVVHELLREHDLDMRVLKGPSCAHLDYEQPEHRSFADIDVLVRGDQFDAVAACLATAGMQRRFDEPRPGFTARFGKGVCFTAPTGLEVDVHRALTSGPFAVAGDAAVLWRRQETIELAGVRVPCLAREERAVAAAVHACLGSSVPRLVPLRDVAQILGRGVDTELVVDIAGQLGVASVLARAVLMARSTLRLDTPLPDEAWALGYRASARERHMLRAYTSEDRTYARQMLAGTRAVKGFGARVDYVRALAFPDRRYLDDRDDSYGRRVSRAMRLLTHRTGEHP